MPVFVVTVDKLTLKNDLLVDICIKESASDYWTSLSEYISFRYMGTNSHRHRDNGGKVTILSMINDNIMHNISHKERHKEEP